MKVLRMVYALLDRKERRRLAALALGMMFIGVIETGGVASVLPFMQLVADPGLLQRPGWAADVYRWIGFESPESALFAAGAALLFIIAFNNAIRALGVAAVGHWGWALNHRLATTLLATYLHQPYPFFVGRNTSELNRRLLEEVGSVVTGVVLPGLEMAAQTIAALLIVTLLAIVDVELAAMVLILFGGSYAVVYMLLRRAQRRFGVERFHQNGRRFKIAGEALAGIKDVKTLGREDEFLRRFADPSRRFATAAARALTMSRVPRYVLETIGFGTILLVILRGLRTGSELGSVMPLLSLYAFAGYRLMPAINTVFSDVLTIRFNVPALEVLHQDLTSSLPRAPKRVAPDAPQRGPAVGPTPPTAPALDGLQSSSGPHGQLDGIEIRRLRFRYPGAAGDTLRDLCVRIGDRQTVGFVGKTGVGKTTLVDIVLGLLTASDGAVLIDGQPLRPESARQWRSRCGYVPQEVFLADDTIAANIAFGVPESEVDEEAVVAAARIAQLHAFVTSLPDGYDTIVGERGVRLSGGQRQRIGIARALYGDPDVLVLDEATSALDGVTESAVMDTIKSLAHRKTILVVAHRLTTVKACDAIHVLEDGRVVASGTYDELLREHPGFRAMAGELPR